jgi:hypothetical protein
MKVFQVRMYTNYYWTLHVCPKHYLQETAIKTAWLMFLFWKVKRIKSNTIKSNL